MTSAQLSGKRIIVTGAASGIGLATAALFEAEGALVAHFDRDASGLEKAGGRGPRILVDQTDADAVRKGVAQAVEALGGSTVWSMRRGLRTKLRLRG